jgi:hypothetical protein
LSQVREVESDLTLHERMPLMRATCTLSELSEHPEGHLLTFKIVIDHEVEQALGFCQIVVTTKKPKRATLRAKLAKVCHVYRTKIILTYNKLPIDIRGVANIDILLRATFPAEIFLSNPLFSYTKFRPQLQDHPIDWPHLLPFWSINRLLHVCPQCDQEISFA